ncbi:sensor domain-containing diguanylate cyclase [Crenobacter intestini]|uniref:diguanylate cyclase n=1 Tax=Crenobacter intestini TaxID=2563443 RepID=A0A4T0V377_9NEIS|nr:sensor domain-containing diguanylate cyclase [Crenobacter intestini]TIC86110.1 GGDEF domain-containing protein [Crenobacter intestini]
MLEGQLLRAVADALSDPIFVIDDGGRYVDVIGGKDRDDYDSGRYLIGRTLHEVLPQAKADRFLGWIRATLTRGEATHYEFSLSATECDGNRREGPHGEQWFETRIAPLKDLPAGMAPCVAWTVFNITRHKALQQQLRYMAASDALTGLANRHAFDELLPRMQAEHRRQGRPLTLALIDLDHFKSVNDRYGHPTGDAALRRFAELLRTYLRAGDVPIRLGGEEFAVLLPATEPCAAMTTLARLQALLREQPFPIGAGATLTLAFSAGVVDAAGLPDSDAAYRAADALLYQAKRAGRDCIVGGDA